MPIIRKAKMREMQRDEILKNIDNLEMELFKERGKIKVGGIPENPGRIRELRRTIARFKTILRERKIRGESKEK